MSDMEDTVGEALTKLAVYVLAAVCIVGFWLGFVYLAAKIIKAVFAS
jgi:hypothetical protein